MPISYDTAVDGSGDYVFGTVASFGCVSGYVLLGAASATCVGDSSSTVGMFDSVTPTCESKLLTMRGNHDL